MGPNFLNMELYLVQINQADIISSGHLTLGDPIIIVQRKLSLVTNIPTIIWVSQLRSLGAGRQLGRRLCST